MVKPFGTVATRREEARNDEIVLAPSSEKEKVGAAERRPTRKPDHALLPPVLMLSVFVAFITTFLFQPFEIPSASMEGTLLHGDRLLVDKVSASAGGVWSRLLPYKGIQRGDVLVFRFSPDPTQYVAKRVIGLPGERLHLVKGEVFINGSPLREPYASRKSVPEDSFRDEFPAAAPNSAAVDPGWRADLPNYVHNGEIVIPAGQYFMLGDNRDESLDSRYWGFVPKENMVGRPFLIYWSMDLPERPSFATSVTSQLTDFAYATAHVPSLTRWRRIFHPVR